MGNYTSDQKTSRFFGLKLNRNTDGAIIEHLEAQENKQEYIKTALLTMMNKESAGCKPYRIAAGKYGCGICGTELNTKQQRYCGNCGQPILWAK